MSAHGNLDLANHTGPADWWNLHGAAKRAQFAGWVGGPDALSRREARRRIMAAGYRSLLDCGCGLCQDYDGFWESGYGIDYLGIDTCRAFVAEATARGVHVCENSVTAIPLADASVDVVYARHVLEHLEDFSHAVREMIRVARHEVMIVYFIPPERIERNWRATFDGTEVFHRAIGISDLAHAIEASRRFRTVDWESLGNEVLLRIHLGPPLSKGTSSTQGGVEEAWEDRFVRTEMVGEGNLPVVRDSPYRRRVRMVVGILTASDNDARQAACLANWANMSRRDVEVVLVTGNSPGSVPRRDGRFLRLPCPDDYAHLSQKTRWLCAWALANFEFEYLLKCDDDTYVALERMLSEQCQGEYIGHDLGGYASGGAGYLLRKRAAEIVVQSMRESTWCEDMLVGRTLCAAGIRLTSDERFHPWRDRWPSPDNRQFTCHYCSVEDMRAIHAGLGRAVDAERRRATRIPRLLHQVWLGGKPLPEEFVRYQQTWKQHHPTWKHLFWTEANLPSLINQQAFDEVPTWSQKSDVVRYEILHKLGGVYVDTDFECLRPIDELLVGLDAFAAEEDDDSIAVGLLGAVAGHPLLDEVIRALPQSVKRGGNACVTTGPGLFTPLAKNRKDICVFDRQLFYPTHYSGTVWGPCSSAHAVHHWAFSWRDSHTE